MRRRFQTAGIAVVAGFVALCVAGCGSGTATVSGTVTYEGKPVTSGSVIIYCADKQIVRGLIGGDGSYEIPNVPPGSATVTIQAHARVPTGLGLKQKDLPPTVDGPITPTVEAVDAHRVSIPARYALPEESGLVIVVDGNPLTYHVELKP